MLTDLTAQKHHETNAAAERLSRLILEQAAEAIVVCDARAGSFAPARRRRRSAKAARFRDRFPSCVSCGRTIPRRSASLRSSRGDATECGSRHGPAGADTRLVVERGSAPEYQQNLGCVITLTDITERKQTEEDMQGRSSCCRRHSASARWEAGTRTPSARDVVGGDVSRLRCTAGHLRADRGEHGWPDPPEDRRRCRPGSAPALAGEQPPELAFRIIPPDGTTRHVLGRGEVVLDAGGRPAYMAGTVQDITGTSGDGPSIPSASRAPR